MNTCPSCNYEYGTGWKPTEADPTKTELVDVKPPQGDFFRLPIKMERKEFFQTDTNGVLGCPRCGNIFMEGRFRP